MAMLNRLAPGRVHLGIGTGNTAMPPCCAARRWSDPLGLEPKTEW